MTQDLRVALTTSLNDRLVGPLRRTLDEVEKNLKEVEKASGRSRDNFGRFVKTTTEAAQATAQAAKEAGDLARNTQNAVGLADKLKAAWSVAGNTIRGVSATVAGIQAAKYVLSAPLAKERSYDRALRDLGNTAYGDLTGPAFTAKVANLDAVLTAALREGGGTREGAVEAASTLMAQGGLNESQMAVVMPTILKAATAANAAPSDIANVVAAALKNGFQPDAIATVIGKAIASGQAGGFEMRDMSKWLPKLLAAGSTIGMTGMRDYEEILGLSQVARTTAGGSDEAGNNLLNFLLKVNATDTQVDARKQGVDLSGTLAANRASGMSAAAAFIALLQKQMDADPRMVKLRAQYDKAGTDGERQASIKAQEQIFAGSALGKFLQDRQALMPAIGALNNPAELKRQIEAARNGGAPTMERAFANIADGNDFKAQQEVNAKLIAQTDALTGVNNALGNLSQITVDLYQEFPMLAAALEGGKLAILTLAAASYAASGALTLLALAGRGAVAGAAGAAAGAAQGAAGNGAGTAAAGALGAGAAATAGAVATGGLLATMFAGSVVARNAEAFSSMGADAGDTAFAAAILDAARNKAPAAQPVSPQDQEANARAALQAVSPILERLEALAERPVMLTVDGQVLAQSLNTTNARTASRH